MKLKCPKCVSARYVVGDPYSDINKCTKCKHSFTDDEGFM